MKKRVACRIFLGAYDPISGVSYWKLLTNINKPDQFYRIQIYFLMPKSIENFNHVEYSFNVWLPLLCVWVLQHWVSSEGRWNCTVKTADIDQLPDVAKNRSSKSREVSLMIYGSESVQGPIELISSRGEAFLPGQTDTFSVSMARSS